MSERTSKLNYRTLSSTKSLNDMTLHKSHAKLSKKKERPRTWQHLVALQYSNIIMKSTILSTMDLKTTTLALFS